MKTISKISYLDLIYEGKNKLYGSYIIRKNYSKRLGIALALLIIPAVLLSIILNQLPNNIETVAKTKIEFNPTQIAPPTIEQVEPTVEPPIEQKELVSAATKKFTSKIEIVTNEQVTSVDKIDMPDENYLAGVHNQEGKLDDRINARIEENLNGEVIINNTKKEEPTIIKEEDVVHNTVSQMPEYPGGLDALHRFINDNIRYPNIAIENHVEGTVVLSFVVDKTGKVKNIKLRKGIAYGCDEEAIRVVKLLKNFKPGLLNDQPVAVNYSIPIKFHLQ